MPKELSKTLGKFRTGIFQELTEKYHSLLSRGETVYNLYVGTPDLLPDRRVTAAVAAAAADPENYKYSIVELPALKKALIDYYKKRYGVELDPDAITATNGTQDSMAHIGIALCNKGDLVMIPDPGYPVFESGVLFSEADPYYYQLLEKNNYLLDFESVPEDVWHRTKYIVTSYPSNPCGALAPKEFYVKLIEYAKKYGFYIVNDNVYSDIIFDGSEGFSFLSIEGAKDVGIEFFSLSKSFNLTGARISFALGNKRLVDAMKVIRSQYDFGMFTPIQYGAIAALTECADSLTVGEEYKRRKEAFCSGMRRIGWNIPDSKGTMFIWAPIPKGYSSCMEFWQALADKAGIICAPGTAFGPSGEGYVRFALIHPVEVIEELVDKVDKAGIIKKGDE